MQIPTLSESWVSLLEQPCYTPERIGGMLARRPAVIETSEQGVRLRLACDADLWCRTRKSITTMLDPSLFETYSTGHEALDEEWVIQSNPPRAFVAEESNGCEALLRLLTQGYSVFSTKGWLHVTPLVGPADQQRNTVNDSLTVRRVLERELTVQSTTPGI